MMCLKKCCWVCLFCAAAPIASPAQAFRAVASFDYFQTGAYPQHMSLVQGSDGNLYGTATEGGTAGWGALFRVTPTGDLALLCDLGGDTCYLESRPFAGLTQATDGNFYGTTWQGGVDPGEGEGNGPGTVFKSTAGENDVTLLYSFCSLANCADGDDPLAPLMQAKDGNFYGTTFDGGAKGYGTVFEITSQGELTTLHSFGYADGAGPVAGLVQAENGNFYGTTLYGGAHGAGAVFEITSGGKLTTLYSFCSQKGCADGTGPYAGLVQAKDGNFYSTTYGGGAQNHGTVFEITPAGKLTTLYSFCSQKKCADGADPYAGVIQATDENFYGTTSKGGASKWGTVFAITAGGKLTTLHSFCLQKNCTDGADPVGGLVQASNGILYGTTAKGGVYENGTVFSLSLGSSSPVEVEPTLSEAAVPIVAPGEFLQRERRHFLPDDVRASLSLGHRHISLGQPVEAPRPMKTGTFNCSPAPCVLPPTQASEGGGTVTDPLIMTNPANVKELLLASEDFNCSPSAVGFHLSRDGGSTWQRVLCMPDISTQKFLYVPLNEPSVGYDHKGDAYVTGLYFDNEGMGTGFVAVQKSTDGTHWSKPVVALGHPSHQAPRDGGSFAVDTSPGSPLVNSVYVSGVTRGTDREHP